MKIQVYKDEKLIYEAEVDDILDNIKELEYFEFQLGNTTIFKV